MEATKTAKAARDMVTVTQLGYDSWVVNWKPECKSEKKYLLHYETCFSLRSGSYTLELEFWMYAESIEATIYFSPPYESKYPRNILIATTN
jgi:hypothetical protein